MSKMSCWAAAAFALAACGSPASAAYLIGDARDIGSVQAGHYADIVAVDGDPLTGISRLERVQFVMKGGTIYKENGKTVPHQRCAADFGPADSARLRMLS